MWLWLEFNQVKICKALENCCWLFFPLNGNHYPPLSLSILSLPISNIRFILTFIADDDFFFFFQKILENSQGLSLHHTAGMRFLPFDVDVTLYLIKRNQNHKHTVINKCLRPKGTQYHTLWCLCTLMWIKVMQLFWTCMKGLDNHPFSSKRHAWLMLQCRWFYRSIKSLSSVKRLN